MDLRFLLKIPTCIQIHLGDKISNVISSYQRATTFPEKIKTASRGMETVLHHGGGDGLVMN